MLTIFSVPKPFEGHIGLIQRNAIRSWTALGPTCQVILCGDEWGAEEAAAEFGVDLIPDVERNEFGTPLLSSVFRSAEERATHDLLCYANGDLIFFPDLLDGLRLVADVYERFLVVGDATNLDLREALEGDFERDLRRRAAAAGSVRGRQWIDYFVFRRGSIGQLPAFAVGRPQWDNWMIWRARSLRIPVVDASATVLVVHQEHSYGHVRQARGKRWDGPEGDRNLSLLKFKERAFSLDDVTHRLTSAGLIRSPGTFRRRIHNEVVLHPWALPVYRPLRRAYQRVRNALQPV
jgi:hypothetical protein